LWCKVSLSHKNINKINAVRIRPGEPTKSSIYGIDGTLPHTSGVPIGFQSSKTRTPGGKTRSAEGYIVAGWFTPDYEHWFLRLEQSLIAWNAPYDFQAVPKLSGGWEANPRLKPRLILDAMHRHSGKTIVWIDVDALCVGDFTQLVGLPCDVAIRLDGCRTRHRVSLMARAGTIVFNPTQKARLLAEAWAADADRAQYGDRDEIGLTLAVGAAAGLVLMNLGELALKVIRHDNASADHKKIKRWDRRRHWLYSKLPSWITGNWIEPEEDTGLRFPPRAGGAA
jgi:hypothetical protein